MKTVSMFLLLMLSIFINMNLSYAEWNQTNGPFGRQISSFFVSGKRLFALTNDNVFLSTNYGSSWYGISNGLKMNGYGFRSFAASGPNLFVNTYGGAFFHSTDNGANWSEYNGSISGSPIWDFAAYDTNLFAGTYGAGVFLSTDGGTSWVPVNNGLNNLSITAVVVKDSNLFIKNSDGIFLSSNNGTSWISIATADMIVQYIAGDNANLFVGVTIGAGSGLYRSSDSGKTWIYLQNLPNTSVAALKVSGKHIFVGSNNYIDGGVFISTDNGESWISAGNDLTNRHVSALTLIDSCLIVGTATAGVYISTNYGTSWVEANNGLHGSCGLCVTALVLRDRNLFAGTWGGGIFLSSDNGINWHEINEGLANKHVLSLAAQGTKLFAGTAIRGIFVSENDGASWTPINDGLPNIGIAQSVLPLAVCDTNLFAGFIGAGIYCTANNGLSWTTINNGLPSQAINSLWCLAAGNIGLFVGGYGVFLSDNYGKNWIADNNGLPLLGANIMSLAVGGTDIFAGTNRNGIFHSTRNSTSWTAVNNGLPMSAPGSELPTLQYEVNCIAASGENVFAGLNYCGIFLTTDKGASWKEVSEGLLYHNIYSLAASDSNVFVGFSGGVGYGNGYGVWHRPLSEMITEVSNRNDHSPSHFLLQQNYPNPFNPSTAIRYALPYRSRVRLQIFNMLGQLVDELVNAEQGAGYQSITWKAKIASGMYLYKLEAVDVSNHNNRFVDTKKMILLK